MKTKKNHPESFEEIVFRNRNKAYGAFLLRKSYSRTVAVAAIITLFVFSVLVSWAVLTVNSTGYVAPSEWKVKVDSAIFLKLVPPPDLPPERELPPPEKPFLRPVIVDSAVENSMTTQGELDGTANPPVNAGTEPGTIDSVSVRSDPVLPPDPGPTFTVVQEMPEFPGGEPEMYRFLNKNITYPASARETGISGTVYLGFVVEPDGSISNLKILRGIGGGCEDEALRVVQMMPKWKPGKQQGHEVRVQFTLPIKFTLQ
jgi:periplasmic protein TonB